MSNVFFNSGFFTILLIIAMSLWIYCLYFFNKYDKNPNKLVMLLILNIYYIPFYLFRIRKLRKENRIKAMSEKVYDFDFIKMSRTSIIEVVELWAFSEEEQIKLQEETDINLLQELFDQWADMYRIDDKIIKEAFTDFEIQLLETFDKTIITVNEKFTNSFPLITEFQKTNDWKVLNQLAKEIIKVIK